MPTAGCYRPPTQPGLIGHHNALDTLAQLKRAGEQSLVHDVEGLLHLFPVNRAILIDPLPLHVDAGGVAGAVCCFKVVLKQPVQPQLAFAAQSGERTQPRRCVFLWHREHLPDQLRYLQQVRCAVMVEQNVLPGTRP